MVARVLLPQLSLFLATSVSALSLSSGFDSTHSVPRGDIVVEVVDLSKCLTAKFASDGNFYSYIPISGWSDSTYQSDIVSVMLNNGTSAAETFQASYKGADLAGDKTRTYSWAALHGSYDTQTGSVDLNLWAWNGMPHVYLPLLSPADAGLSGQQAIYLHIKPTTAVWYPDAYNWDSYDGVMYFQRRGTSLNPNMANYRYKYVVRPDILFPRIQDGQYVTDVTSGIVKDESGTSKVGSLPSQPQRWTSTRYTLLTDTTVGETLTLCNAGSAPSAAVTKTLKEKIVAAHASWYPMVQGQ